MTITVNNTQYAKNEVLKMVMNKAHSLYKVNTDIFGRTARIEKTFASALKRAWREVKQSLWVMANELKISAQRAIDTVQTQIFSQELAKRELTHDRTTAQKRIEELQKAQFFHEMKDTWNYADWEINRMRNQDIDFLRRYGATRDEILIDLSLVEVIEFPF